MIPSATAVRLLSAGAVLVACAALACTTAAAEDVADVPRYRLQVGQELTYRQTSEAIYRRGDQTGKLGSETEWHVWVVRQNDDRSWRIVLLSSDKSWSSKGKDAKVEQPVRSTMGACDLCADGHILSNASLASEMNPHVFFPKLPDDASPAGKGWESLGGRYGVCSRFTTQPKPGPDGEWVFDEVVESPLHAVLLWSWRSQFFFDRKRGIVLRAEREDHQGYPIDVKGSGTMVFRGCKEHDKARMKQFAAETDRYFAAVKVYDTLVSRARKEHKESEELLSKAAAALKEVRSQLTVQVLRDQVEERLKAHGEEARLSADDAKRLANVVGKPAAEWETKDLKGKPHALKDYRGKVVVLDFWFRRCGWCMRAMPQVKQLADDFQKEPVVVLGMSTDEDENDARFVAEKMKLSYPVLKAQGVPKKYEVSSMPTLIIIDQEGKIHDVHVGYSPTLREDVARIVRALLEKK